MRIIGKDSYVPEYKTRTYRGFKVRKECGGWCTNIDGDNNIYKSYYSAYNAIDKYYGNRDGYSNLRQIKAGIKIIGQKE